jgi:prepilin-type N-terminal cleavage/methylation domain-containing protein
VGPERSPRRERAPGPRARGSAGGRASAAGRAFTLLEVMAVTVLLSLLLLMLPPRLDGFGARSRLEAGANTILSAFTGARDQAIIDGHEVWIQFDLGKPRDRAEPGRFRYVVANRVTDRAAGPTDGTEEPAPREIRGEDEEMVPMPWRAMPDGVVLVGFSTERDQWAKSNPDDQPFTIRYLPDGGIRPPCAVRLESSDLPPDAERTMTVIVNALTGRAGLHEGEADLPPSRDAAEFK